MSRPASVLWPTITTPTQKDEADERTLDGHIDLSPRGSLPWQPPYGNAGAAQNKVADAAMIAHMSFAAHAWARLGMNFKARRALRVTPSPAGSRTSSAYGCLPLRPRSRPRKVSPFPCCGSFFLRTFVALVVTAFEVGKNPGSSQQKLAHLIGISSPPYSEIGAGPRPATKHQKSSKPRVPMVGTNAETAARAWPADLRSHMQAD